MRKLFLRDDERVSSRETASPTSIRSRRLLAELERTLSQDGPTRPGFSFCYVARHYWSICDRHLLRVELPNGAAKRTDVQVVYVASLRDLCPGVSRDAPVFIDGSLRLILGSRPWIGKLAVTSDYSRVRARPWHLKHRVRIEFQTLSRESRLAAALGDAMTLQILDRELAGTISAMTSTASMRN